MNLLPISLAFILVFYYFCASSWNDLKTNLNMNQASHRFFESQRVVHNRKQNSFYKAEMKDPKDNALEKGKNKESEIFKKTNQAKPFVYHREKTLPYFSTAKLNLYWLISKQDDDPVVIRLRKIALSLIRDLYKDSGFYYEGLEDKIVNFITQTTKEHPQMDTLQEIFACYSGQDPAIYKAFKGTAECTLTPRRGYPSLLTFISIKKEKSPIGFFHAHAEVLKAAFGATIFDKIKEAEKQKWKEGKGKVLLNTELEFLLSQFTDKDALEVYKLINFSSSIKDKSPKKELSKPIQVI